MNSKLIKLGLIALSLFMTGCQSLPSLDGRTQSFAYSKEEVAETYFAKALLPVEQLHGEGKSGIYPLIEADEAFAARMVLAKYAQRSLDVQYYIWRRDMTGTMLFEALHEAADRGVRVRLLLDDNNTNGSDPILLGLNGHENIEVRLFNPFMLRKPRWWGFLTDFSRLNRRMHNKSFIADNSLSIIGGRNIGDEYFGATDDVLFADLDILSAGAAVQDVSNDFDKYWHSQSSYPLDRVVSANNAMTLIELRERANQIHDSEGAQQYVESLRESQFITQLEQRKIDFEWLQVRMVSDDPRKGLGLAEKETLLIHQFQDIIGDPTVDVELVSPYFVPTAAGAEAFAWLVRKGVEVKVLTNSLSATDVAAVHAGYAKRRKALLKSGVILYEMQRHPTQVKRMKRKKRFLGSSGSSLHAKTFSVDRKHVFIGSFNFDPRSANLNTELGFVIDSQRLAQRINQAFYDEIPAHAYQVRLSDSGRIYWTEQRDVGVRTYTSEPNSSVWRRVTTHLLSWLPIEGLL
ncbi:MAG TPA: phospholipase D family protein [Gammaproteobacteria bacterium]|nr:phospholipase D family protein [Gammaproteobacteria bacterium]